MMNGRGSAGGWTVPVAACMMLLTAASVMAHPVADRDPVAMITVPAGPFLMGSPAGFGLADEQPQRRVHLEAFAIDKWEVTNARYLRFVKATGHKPPPNPYGAIPLSAMKGIDDLPVVQVTWHDAADYCQWAGKRLPTEAEWEKAARGSDGRRFPWGNDAPTALHANFDREWDGVRTLRPIGSFPEGRSPYGVEDMAGNAREWVQDWYDPAYYAGAPNRNPTGPERGLLKSIRGGSWRHAVNDIRSAMRGKGGFALKTDGTGFRCARSIGGS
jgi:sulfatase modifying factor 1